jgi:hypothetical protein
MLQVTFQSDGKVQVFAMKDGDVISVTTDGHRLPAMLPTETAEALWRSIAELHETLAAVLALPQIAMGEEERLRDLGRRVAAAGAAEDFEVVDGPDQGDGLRAEGA